MRILMYSSFSLAGIMSLAAILGRMGGLVSWVPVGAMIIAAIGLVVGFYARYQLIEPEPVVMAEDRQEIIREKLSMGDYEGVKKQMDMWYPRSTPEDIEAAIKGVG